MPRTTTLDCPGCPPLRALTFDVLGLVKVVEARSKDGGNPKVVERWGDPDSSKCVLATCFDDSEFNPLVAVARKNGVVEMLNPLNGELSFSISHCADDGTSAEDDPIVGLQLFKKQRLESSARSCPLLTCTSKGNASIRIVDVPDSPTDSLSAAAPKTWNVCSSGNITCCKVDASEKYSLFGGKGVEVSMWDLESVSKSWTSKAPPKNSLGIFTPTWFTSATFLNKDDHRKFVTGTNNHQVRIYDISAQRRPVLSVDFRDTAIKSVAEDVDGHRIYIGNGSGDLASIDIRTGKLLGCFIGKCSGSIRSIVRHPKLPVIASCGLDSYVRFWDTESRQLLSAVFLKQHLTSVVFDSHFSDDGPETVTDVPKGELQDTKENLTDDEDEEVPSPEPTKRKKSSKKSHAKKEDLLEDEEAPSPAPTKRKKASKKSHDKKENLTEDEDEQAPSPAPTKGKKVSKKNRDKKDKQMEDEDEEALSPAPTKQKKASKKSRGKEQQPEELNGDASDDDCNDGSAPTKRKKASKELGEKKLKAKRSKKEKGETS